MLTAKEIRKSYRRKEVLKGVSFTVKPGECVGIVGANGCGKTTLLSILAGAQRADGGSLSVDGAEALGNPKLLSKGGLCASGEPFDSGTVGKGQPFFMVSGKQRRAAPGTGAGAGRFFRR